ncbi:MAG: hypothetical protein AB7J19_08300, partial [Beijerinckiaceae bacterium]
MKPEKSGAREEKMKRFFAAMGLCMAFSGAILSASLAPASATELVYGTWASPKHSAMRFGMNQFFKNIAKETKGA